MNPFRSHVAADGEAIRIMGKLFGFRIQILKDLSCSFPDSLRDYQLQFFVF